MKLKLDENLPESLLSELSRLGHDVDNVRTESLTGRDDADVWKAAQKAQRILVKTSTFRTCANSLLELITGWCWFDCAFRGEWLWRGGSERSSPQNPLRSGSAVSCF